MKPSILFVGVIFFTISLVLITTHCNGLTSARSSSSNPKDWIKGNRTNSNTFITLTIVLKQSNLFELETLLLNVSNPQSNQYGKYLPLDEVDKFTSPSLKAIQALLQFYSENQIDDFTHSSNFAFSSFTTTTEKIESLLNTQYYDYISKDSKYTISRCETYETPSLIKDYVQVIGPTTRFPSLRSFHFLHQKQQPSYKKDIISSKKAPSSFASCDGSLNTPSCLRQLYQIPENQTAIDSSTVCVTGYLEQYVSLKDLNTFFQSYDNTSLGRVPNITGPNNQSNPGIEASLDIQYVMSIGHGANATFWYTPGRQPKNPQNEPFLVFLQALASDSNAPWIVSTSYGDDESSVDPDYYQAINTEFQKAGVRGISMLFSSGDSGAGCLNNIFDPTAPASSPWITSIGSTQNYSPEAAASFSTGGFSNVWPMPGYQATAVNAFLTNYGKSTLPPASLWNSSGNARAYPDISTQGVNFPIILGGFQELVYGTSCSSPTFAGMLSLLNSIRLENKKSTLGFLNQLIYQNPGVFNDITKGNNIGTGCNGSGWTSVQGWDPITGLGTPNFPALVKLVQNLP